MSPLKSYRIEFFERGASQTEMPDYIDVSAETRTEAMRTFWMEAGKVDKLAKDLLVVVSCKEFNRPLRRKP